ncbi:TPR_REGION domain-containing protein [Tenacibaculum sp. 190524A05c]|uniref:hypothetical protein n=1 Tax=Tenacibaculum platacis TaxID=3137852 RepID=UPI0031FA4B80
MSNVPTIRKFDWISIFPHLMVLSFLILVYYVIFPNQALLFGSFTYLLISRSIRYFIPKYHRLGIKAMNEEEYEYSILNFEKSYQFFSNRSWIDKYRYLTLLSSSKMSYREMALNNIAFSYGQLGEGKKAMEYYLKLKEEFPENGVVDYAIRMMNSAKNTEL